MPSRTSPTQSKRDDSQGSRRAPEPSVKEASAQTADQLLRQAVALWLQWNEAYEQATARAFQAGGDQRKLEAIMDEMDAVRRKAIQASREARSQRRCLGARRSPTSVRRSRRVPTVVKSGDGRQERRRQRAAANRPAPNNDHIRMVAGSGASPVPFEGCGGSSVRMLLKVPD